MALGWTRRYSQKKAETCTERNKRNLLGLGERCLYYTHPLETIGTRTRTG